MRNSLAALTGLLFLIACHKNATQPDYFHEVDYHMNDIIVSSVLGLAATDTTGNKIEFLSFGKMVTYPSDDSTYTTGYGAGGSWDTWGSSRKSHIYSIRYLPSEPLLGSLLSKYTIGSQVGMYFRIDPRLAGQQLFEIYDTTAKRLNSKIFADSAVTIRPQLTRMSTDPDSLRKAYNYYIDKLKSGILYFYSE